MTKKESEVLIQAFEDMYKYYHGWHFGYEYPRDLFYHQMGGDLSVAFTPDFNEPGEVSIQVRNNSGQTLEEKAVLYRPPIDAYDLFRIVRPFLDANSKW